MYFILFIIVLAVSLAFLFLPNALNEREENKAEKKIVFEAHESEGTETKNMPPATSTLKRSLLAERPLPILPPLLKIDIPKEIILPPEENTPPALSAATIATTSAPGAALPLVLEEKSQLLPLNEEALLAAVVKIQCPAADGKGIYVGSGFALEGNKIATAAHLVMNSGSDTCEVIFPRERRPIYYLKGTIDNRESVKKRHDQEGIDTAFLTLTPIESYPEAKAIFPEYPFVPYPVCSDPAMRGDSLIHFGYPSNFAGQNYLSEQDGKLEFYADIAGVEEQLSQDQIYTFKTPKFVFTNNEEIIHPYIVSRVATFYGDSGGLAFNAAKQCILGIQRGGTIGKSAGENYSIIMNLGWYLRTRQ